MKTTRAYVLQNLLDTGPTPGEPPHEALAQCVEFFDLFADACLCLVKTSFALILLTFWTPVAIVSQRILALQQAVDHSEARTS